MRGSPRSETPEHRPLSATPPAPRAEPAPAERVSTSRYAKPKVLMGEVTAPVPALARETAKQREAFRAFMIGRHLSPSEWARAAAIPLGEILAFLTGRSRQIAPQSLEKLARAAGCAPEDMFR